MSKFILGAKPKQDEKPSLFLNKKEIEIDEKPAEEPIPAKPTNLFGGIDRQANRGNTRESSGGTGTGSSSGEGNSINGGSGEGNRSGVFSFDSADSNSTGNVGGENRGSGQTAIGTVSDEMGTSRQTASGGEKSPSESNVNRRPSWLSFSSSSEEEKKDEEIKEIKVAKRKGRPPKRNQVDGVFSEEQIEVLFCGLFDGIALFRGNHWKLQEDEKEIIPALARIINRMAEALPAKYMNQAFNFMDYAVVLGGVGAIVYKRILMEKGDKKNNVQKEASRTVTGNTSGTVPVQVRSEDNQPRVNDTNIRPVEQSQRNENGISSLSPIADLAQSINRVL